MAKTPPNKTPQAGALLGGIVFKTGGGPPEGDEGLFRDPSPNYLVVQTLEVRFGPRAPPTAPHLPGSDDRDLSEILCEWSRKVYLAGKNPWPRRPPADQCKCSNINAPPANQYKRPNVGAKYSPPVSRSGVLCHPPLPALVDAVPANPSGCSISRRNTARIGRAA